MSGGKDRLSIRAQCRRTVLSTAPSPSGISCSFNSSMRSPQWIIRPRQEAVPDDE